MSRYKNFSIKRVAYACVLPSPEDIRNVILEICKNPSEENLDYARHITGRMIISPWFYFGSNYEHLTKKEEL